MKIGIITDSTASLDLVNYTHPHVKVIDFSLALDGVNYKISDLDPDEFYNMMEQAKELPRTSQGSVADVIGIFEQFEAEGYTDVFVMTISSKLSGSYANIVTASQEFENLNIHLIDSKTTAYFLGDAVVQAAKLIDEGKNVEELTEALHKMYDNDGVYFYVDSLKYLVKGGRISGAAGMVGEVFKIKPVIDIADDGTLNLVKKNRTKKKTISMLFDMYYEQTAGKPHRLFCFYTDNKSEVEEIAKQIKNNENVLESVTVGITPAVSSHIGGGVIGIGWRFL